MELEILARAKVNLTLDILGVRQDGYHEVAMVMQEVGLADKLRFCKIPAGIKLTVENSDLPADSSNLAYKAAELMQGQGAGGVEIVLEKNIPLAAGLAGGSSDAAAVLKGVNQLYKLGLSMDKLAELGATIGSDIPFCIYGKTMLATGRGEILTPLPAFPKSYFILAKPPLSISTAWAYRKFDSNFKGEHPDNKAMQNALANGDYQAAIKQMQNVLEDVSIKEYPLIQEYKDLMLGLGADFAMMSGSGPTVFGLARTKEQADKVYQGLLAKGVPELFLTEGGE